MHVPGNGLSNFTYKESLLNRGETWLGQSNVTPYCISEITDDRDLQFCVRCFLCGPTQRTCFHPNGDSKDCTLLCWWNVPDLFCWESFHFHMIHFLGKDYISKVMHGSEFCNLLIAKGGKWNSLDYFWENWDWVGTRWPNSISVSLKSDKK